MVDALLLELEAVIADVTRLRREALVASLERVGEITTVDDVANADDGRPDGEIVRRLLSDRPIARDESLLDLVATDATARLVDRLWRGFVLQPGAGELVRSAAAQIPVLVVTRLPRTAIEPILSLGELADHATLTVTADDVQDGKPAPESYALAMERLERRRGVAARHPLALEGSLAGIRSAHAAGVPCIAVGDLSPEVAMEAQAYLPSLVGESVRTLQLRAQDGGLTR